MVDSLLAAISLHSFTYYFGSVGVSNPVFFQSFVALILGVAQAVDGKSSEISRYFNQLSSISPSFSTIVVYARAQNSATFSTLLRRILLPILCYHISKRIFSSVGRFWRQVILWNLAIPLFLTILAFPLFENNVTLFISNVIVTTAALNLGKRIRILIKMDEYYCQGLLVQNCFVVVLNNLSRSIIRRDTFFYYTLFESVIISSLLPFPDTITSCSWSNHGCFIFLSHCFLLYLFVEIGDFAYPTFASLVTVAFVGFISAFFRRDDTFKDAHNKAKALLREFDSLVKVSKQRFSVCRPHLVFDFWDTYFYYLA